MEFKSGAMVYTNDSRKVGRIKHVVMTPHTQSVTALVIERGFLVREEKVLPLDWIDRIDADGAVMLHEDKRAFNDLPAFEQTFYVPRTNDVPDDVYYYYGNPGYLGNTGYAPVYGAFPAVIDPLPNRVEKTVENIPEDTVALEIGAEVTSRDDQHVGKLEEIITNSGTHQSTHFLISKGLFFQTRKLVPTDWIERVESKHVFLSVDAKLLERLPDYDINQWAHQRT
ncbi:MAG: PRC-barrel domain-containing protein [Chloroflexota bacterium]|nr:PRC-barrel domain-containing protein [Chloroflexota bacterium]